MAQRDLKVTLIGDDKTGKAFGSAGKSATGFGDSLKKAGGFAAMAFGGAVVAGVAGFGAALIGGARDAANMERILAQTSAVVKSTGGAANVSTEQIESFANSIEKATGIEAENVIEGQNMLLTFTNIKNGVGEGNQVFDEATTVLADMSTAMGTDMSSSAVLLGKALNDPIAGVGALSKAGVQLTDAQKEQIKGFVESGDAMSAQKIILGELTTQFGGSAEAFGNTLPGQIAKAKNAFGDMFESLAVNLLPTVSALVVAFTAHVPAALERIGPAFATLQTAFSAFFAALREGDVTSDGLVGKFEMVGDALHRFGVVAIPVAVAAFHSLVAAAQVVGAAVMSTVDFFRQNETAAKGLGIVVAAVATAIGAAWVAQGIVATVNAAKSAVAWFATATASTTSATIQSKSTAQIVVGWVASTASAVASAARQVAAWVLLGAQSLLHAAKVAAAWLIAMGPIGLVIAAVIGVVALIVANWATISRVTSELWNKVQALTSAAWTAIRSAVATGIASVITFFSGLPGRILGALGNLGGLLSGAGRAVIDGFLSGITGAFGRVRDTLGRLTSMLPDWKGPAQRDATILRDAGRLVMGGFEDGLVSKFGDVKRTLGDVTDLVGMQVGGASYVQGRIAATASSPVGMPAKASDPSAELVALLEEQNALLRKMPKSYRVGDRQGLSGG